MRTAEPLLPASYRKIVRGRDHTGVTDIKGSQSPVSTDVVRVRYQPGGIPGSGCVVRIAIVQNLGECIDAAQVQAFTEAPVDIDLKCVVGTVPLRHPGP